MPPRCRPANTPRADPHPTTTFREEDAAAHPDRSAGSSHGPITLGRTGQRRSPDPADDLSMTTPAWTRTDLTGDVAEPFRSDPDFWSSVSASADALLTMVLAAAAAIALALTVGPIWSPLPFIAPFALLIRAALSGRASARRSRESFAAGGRVAGGRAAGRRAGLRPGAAAPPYTGGLSPSTIGTGMTVPRISPTTFRRLAFAGAVLLAAIVVTGGAVRLTGSGLGCPTWPRCTATSIVAPGVVPRARRVREPRHHHAGRRLRRRRRGRLAAADPAAPRPHAGCRGAWSPGSPGRRWSAACRCSTTSRRRG